MLEMSIRGAAELREVAALLRAEQRLLQRNVNQGTRKAVKPLERAIRAEIPLRMPRRYAGVLEGALKVVTSLRGAGLTLTIKAAGLKSNRDVAARDRGSLRHPVFGRATKRWVDQRITPGFVANPIRATADEVYRELDKVAEGVRERVERG
jgi:creatinine amidohydrolase/Fe(II)-dependent formamide hydrolase-like protein